VLTNEVYLNRIEELENALERLLDCFDTSFEGRPFVEVEVEDSALVDGDYENPTVIREGQVNQTTADAVEFANEVLYQEVEEWGGIEE